MPLYNNNVVASHPLFVLLIYEYRDIYIKCTEISPDGYKTKRVRNDSTRSVKSTSGPCTC